MKTQYNTEKTYWTSLDTLRGINDLQGLSLYVQHNVPSIDEGVVETCYVVRCEEDDIFPGVYAGRDLKFYILGDDELAINPTLMSSIWVDQQGTCHEADEITHRFLEYLTSHEFIENVVFSEVQQEEDEAVEEDIINKVLSTDKDIKIRIMVDTLIEAGYLVDLNTEIKVTQDGYTKITRAKVIIDGQPIDMEVEDGIFVDPADVMLIKEIEGQPEDYVSHSRALIWRDLVTRWLKEDLQMDVIFLD